MACRVEPLRTDACRVAAGVSLRVGQLLFCKFSTPIFAVRPLRSIALVPTYAILFCFKLPSAELEGFAVLADDADEAVGDAVVPGRFARCVVIA